MTVTSGKQHASGAAIYSGVFDLAIFAHNTAFNYAAFKTPWGLGMRPYYLYRRFYNESMMPQKRFAMYAENPECRVQTCTILIVLASPCVLRNRSTRNDPWPVEEGVQMCTKKVHVVRIRVR